MSPKLYVVVSRDMKASQRAIQAGHAVADFLIRNPNSSWRGHSLVYLKVDTEAELEKLLGSEAEIGYFREPYWNNKLTAVALHGTGVSELLAGLPLL